LVSSAKDIGVEFEFIRLNSRHMEAVEATTASDI
jgi:hypothetical protein